MARGRQQREEVFAHEYVIDGNATRAALAAGYPESSAHARGSELVKNSKVAARIAELNAKRLAKRDITAQMVLDGLAALATFDPRRLYNEDGSLKPISELDDETAKAIAGFEVHELCIDGDGKGEVGQVKKIKLLDRGQNLERLGRTMAMFTDKVKHEGFEGLAEAIAKGRKRVGDG